MNRTLKRWAIDYFATATFAFTMDFLVAMTSGVRYYPTILVFSLTGTFVFRSWSGRLYGLYVNMIRNRFGEGEQ